MDLVLFLTSHGYYILIGHYQEVSLFTRRQGGGVARRYVMDSLHTRWQGGGVARRDVMRGGFMDELVIVLQ